MYVWIVETDRFSITQKGAMPRKGLQEHVFSLKTTISDFLHNTGQLFVSYVDLKDAFGSLNHAFMINQMQDAQYPELFINITKDIYKDSCFIVRTHNGETPVIKREKGIIQGCPWSVIAFEQGLDKWLRWMETSNEGVQGYVDDVVFHTHNLAEMQSLCQKTTDFLNYTHMEAKPAKCAVSAAKRSSNTHKPPVIPEITIQNKEIPIYHRDKCYVYLGHEICLSNQNDQADSLVNEFYKNMKKVDKAPLPFFYKLQLIQTICISPLTFFFDNILFAEKQLEELTTIIVNHVRNWLGLNQSSTRSFLFAPKAKGGLGLPHPRILYYAKHLSFFLAVMNSSDDQVKAMALNSLQLHLTKRKAQNATSMNDPQFAGYLTDEKGNFKKQSITNWPKSQWQHISSMCAREQVRLIHHAMTDNSFSLVIKTETGDIEHKSSKTFYDMYKTTKLNEIAKEFTSLHSQGRITREAIGVDYKLSLCFIQNKNLKDKIKQFAIKSKLQLLECNTLLHTYNQNINKSCSLCNHPNDTCSHILNGCTKIQSFYIERHNRIVDLIFDKVKYHGAKNNLSYFKEKLLTPSLFMYDESFRFISNAIKPDIVTIDYDLKEVKIIEISTPFDAFIDTTYQSKFDKYFPLTLEISNFGFTAEIIVLIVGSCGTVHKHFVSGLKKCDIPNHDAKFLARYCSISSIIGSYRAWKRRCKLLFKDA